MKLENVNEDASLYTPLPDCQTMMKVPSVIHGNVSHTGGINAMNKKGAELYNNKKQRENVGGRSR
ncbi:MAG: hypothetical protein J5554_06145 [Paludibacteraceae bacterium]|nr:hypothetical protein [Paludibacteraceae bacterium]